MKSSLFHLILLFLALNSCQKAMYVYQAQPVDITVVKENGRVTVKGSSAFQRPDSFVWCGSPIRIKDQYFLFYSSWESGAMVPPFADSWVLRSKIGCAVSDSPYGDFDALKLFLTGRRLQGDSLAWDAQMVHNPLIKTFNGKYYLYYGAGRDPGIQPKGSPGERLNQRNRVQQSQQIGVIEFNSIQELLAGNFKRFDQPLLSPRTRVKSTDVVDPSPLGTIAKPDNMIVVNPAVEYRPSDGKYLLFFKGNLYDPTWRGVHGVATADSPTGPFTATDEFVFDINDGKGNKVSAEDPYVWYHRRQKMFYAVMKDFTGKLTGGEPGLAMMQSKDGIQWEAAAQPLFMKKELILMDGTHLKVNRLERPQILLDKNDDPMVLCAACSVDDCNGKKDGGTFNVQIPLKKIKVSKHKPANQ